MVSAGMACIKYLLFCFNLIFAISGLAILTVGAVIQAAYHHYSEFVDSSFWSAPVLLIVVGSVVFVIAFFGCCGAVKENHCMIITFSVFLLIVFVVELSAGIAGYIKHGELQSILETRFNESMTSYNTNNDSRQAWDIIQNDLQCCGINGPSDWNNVTNHTLPLSCCHEVSMKSTCEPANAHTEGCMPKLLDLLQSKSLLLGGVGVGIAIVQLLGVAFSCCLARSIRKEYETV